MKFLHDYPTLEKLKGDYPGIQNTNTRLLTSTNTVDALSGVPQGNLASLRTKYSDGEILYGLRILFGVGKGKNHIYNTLNLHNGLIVKYGADKDTILDVAAQARLVRCVGMARAMALKGWQEIGNAGSLSFILNARQNTNESVSESILKYHFGNDANSHLRQIKEIYKKIHTKLLDHIIIAARVEDDRIEGGNSGYVDWRYTRYDVNKNLISSPFHTRSVQWHDDRKKINRLRENKAALVEKANKFGVEPTIEAVFMCRSGSIHIQFDEITDNLSIRRTDLGIATHILHEASHKFGYTGDYAYTYTTKYEGLTTACRIKNADSYAYAAASLYLNRLIEDEYDRDISTYTGEA